MLFPIKIVLLAKYSVEIIIIIIIYIVINRPVMLGTCLLLRSNWVRFGESKETVIWHILHHHNFLWRLLLSIHVNIW